MKRDLSHIEEQLKKRLAYPYKWYRKQNDVWDGYTNFIYSVPDWDELVKEISTAVRKHGTDRQETFHYAINRWYNFWSAIAVEQIFCGLDGVTAAKNNKDRLVDFTLKGIPFDHKTSVFPKEYGKTSSQSGISKEELLYWLYDNQSGQQRQHFSNRLFIIVYKEDGEHWKLKAEISLLQKAITDYVAIFDPSKLVTLKFGDRDAVSDIIWVKK